MAALENEIDVNFYNLIHELVGFPGQDDSGERRGAERKPFPSMQRIAQRRGPGIPEASEFIEVKCHDLTRRGFSFLLPSQPNFHAVVAAFGTPPKVIYVAARVSHYHHVLVYPSGLVKRMEDRAVQVGSEDLRSQSATPMVLVGCRFTERLSQ